MTVLAASGIYQIRNTANGKIYVGSAVRLDRRWREHKRRLSKGEHHNPILTKAWLKYGTENFVFEPLFVCAKKDLLFYEQRALDVLKPSYNICRTAGSMLGVERGPHRPEHIAALRAAQQKRRATAVPEKRTDEQRKRMSEAQKKVFARGPRARAPHTEETKLKIALALRGKKKSPEHAAKCRASRLGRRHSEEAKAKIAAWVPSDAARKKMSESAKLAWAIRKGAPCVGE